MYPSCSIHQACYYIYKFSSKAPSWLYILSEIATDSSTTIYRQHKQLKHIKKLRWGVYSLPTCQFICQSNHPSVRKSVIKRKIVLRIESAALLHNQTIFLQRETSHLTTALIYRKTGVEGYYKPEV